MGTNYYLANDTTNRTAVRFKEHHQEIHIGKLSNGWRFLFQGDTIDTYTGWKQAIKDALTDGWTLRNEYGTTILYNDLILDIDKSIQGKVYVAAPGVRWTDNDGWPFAKGDFC